MIRFIIKRDVADNVSGARFSNFETLDVDVPELECILKSGGYGESGFDLRTFAGVEILHSSTVTSKQCGEN